MEEDVSDKCVYLHFSLRTCRFLHRLGKKNPNEVPWGEERKRSLLHCAVRNVTELLWTLFHPH